MDCDLQQLVKCLVVAVLHVRWRYTWIVIRSGCYVLLKAGRYDKEILDHLAVDLCFTCHIGEYMRSVSISVSICWWLDVSRQGCVVCCHLRFVIVNVLLLYHNLTVD